MPPQPPGLLTTWQREHNLWNWRVVCLRRWSAAQEHHRGLYSPCFSSLCTSTEILWWLCSCCVLLVNHNSHLILNQSKQKTVEFRRTRSRPNSVCILGEEVEVVEEHRYLGVYLDDRLDWKCNIETIFMKEQKRLYFVRKLRSFRVCTDVLYIFYIFYKRVQSAL